MSDEEAIQQVAVALAKMSTFSYGGLNTSNLTRLIEIARAHQRTKADLETYNALFMKWVADVKPRSHEVATKRRAKR